MGWTEEQQQFLRDIEIECVTHMHLQSGSAYTYNIIHNCINIPTIMLGAVTSVTIFSTTSQAWKIATGIMSITSTILTAISKQVVGERVQHHVTSVRQYHGIIRRIRMYSIEEPSEQECSQILSQLHLELEKIISVQHDPSYFAVRYFQNKYNVAIESLLHPCLTKLKSKNESNDRGSSYV